MKKLLLLPIISLLLVSCQGDPGPPGRDGVDGLDGINILGQIFEAQVDFNANNNYEVLVDIPTQIEVFDTDVVIAYILIGENNGIDIWEPLPQTLFFNDGILLYGYNFTFEDILFFLDGTVLFDNLPPETTQGVIFRVAILPADAANGLDLNNFENVMNSLKNKEIIRLD
jgi:hypothetical protein